MNLPRRCGADCVLPPDRTQAQPLSLSARVDEAWVVEDRVVRKIASGWHDPGHPFYYAGAGAGTDERAELLRRIRDSDLRHVVPVDAVCKCSFTMPALAGGPMQDFGLAGDGNRLIHPKERHIAWPAATLGIHLAGLADGLLELHHLGIAHGDPALMNAYIRDLNDVSVAVWVDLNSVHSATPAAVALDIAAFELTCLWPALLDSSSHSPSLFRDLVAIARNEADPLSAYSIALTRERGDHGESSARSDLLEALTDGDPSSSGDILDLTRRRVSAAMAPIYFLDQTKSDQNARFYSATLAAERARHVLLEEERTRLHGIRYQGEIQALQVHTADLTAAAAQAQGEIQELRLESEDLRRDLSLERAMATELGNENARLRNSLNEIYISRAWRLISRLRAIMALPAKAWTGRRRSPSSMEAPGAGAIDQLKPVKVWSPPVESYPFLVSVVMPVYNKGSTLRGSIESVMSQTLTPVEIVVWDDGSMDPETLRVLDEVGALPNVTVFRAANQGVVGARNSSIVLSRGRYICCLDPDDEIAPTYLEIAVALLEAQPEYAIAYPWVHSVGDVEERWETQDLDPSLITRANHLPVCAVFRRELFVETGGFSPEMIHGYEDWEFWVHAAELGFRGKSIPAHLLTYRFSLDSDESRDAKAREKHQQLVDEIARLHPRLARTGVPFDRPTPTRVRPVGLELGKRRLPAGTGQPVILVLPWFTVGGADRVVESLCRHWVADGRTVVVFTTTPLAPGMSDRRHELDRVTPYVYPLQEFLPVGQWYEFVTATVDALGSPVILNVGSSWFYDNAKALRRDFPQVRMVDQQFNHLAHLPRNRSVASVIDLTIAAYDGLAEEIAHDGRLSTVAPVYVGIDDMPTPGADEIAEFRNRVGVSTDERLVLFVGRLADEKRPEWVVRLAIDSDLEATRVVIVGDGPLREDVSEAALSSERLTWIPEVETVEPAIAAADLLVLPSKIEGIPLVAMEALALGTPIVATRVGGLPDLEPLDGVFLTEPDDFNSFLEAVRIALEKPPDEVSLPHRFRTEEMVRQYDKLLFDV